MVGLFSASIEINFHRARRKKRNFPNFLLSNPLGMFQLVVGSDKHGTFYRPFLPPSSRCSLCTHICIKHVTTKLAFDRPSTYSKFQISRLSFIIISSRKILEQRHLTNIVLGKLGRWSIKARRIGILVDSRERRPRDPDLTARNVGNRAAGPGFS